MKSQTNEVIDGYILFFNEVFPGKNHGEIVKFLWQFTQDSLFRIDDKKDEAWLHLKNSIQDCKDGKYKRGYSVYVRTFGDKNNEFKKILLQDFYEFIFKSNFVKIDGTNNQRPTAVLAKYTNYTKKEGNKKKQLVNYQVSHVFGKTLNCYAFVAPWDIVYLPKILDPFTGHESKGEITTAITENLQKFMIDEYYNQIVEFNNIMNNDFLPKIKAYREKKEEEFKHKVDNKNTVEEFFTQIEKNFSPIEIEKTEK